MSADVLTFFAAGMPEPEGSTRAFVVGGRPVITHTKGGALRRWRDAVRAAALTEAEAVVWDVGHDAPVEVTAHFTLPRPARPRFKDVPGTKPDLDKLARAVGDAITQERAKGGGVVREGLIFDDSRIVTWHATKAYATDETPTGVLVTILKTTGADQ